MQHSNSEATTNKTVINSGKNTTYTLCSLFFLQNWNMVVNGKDHIYDDDDETLDSKNMNICQFERNPDFETTIRARLNPKHVDERARIVQETTNKISQSVRCRLHVHRWGRVGLNIWKCFERVSRGKVSTVAIVILLDALHDMIWFDRYVKSKGPTYRSKRVWGWSNYSVMLMHVHIWNLRDVQILLCV